MSPARSIVGSESEKSSAASNVIASHVLFDCRVASFQSCGTRRVVRPTESIGTVGADVSAFREIVDQR